MAPKSPSESSCWAAKAVHPSTPLATDLCAAAEISGPVTRCSPSRHLEQQQLWPEADDSCAGSCCRRAAAVPGKEARAAQDQAGSEAPCTQGRVKELSDGGPAQPPAQGSMRPPPGSASGAAPESGQAQPQDMCSGGPGRQRWGRRGQGRAAVRDPPALVRVDESAPLRALCGVRVVWASVEARRQGVASKLLDLARWYTRSKCPCEPLLCM